MCYSPYLYSSRSYQMRLLHFIIVVVIVMYLVNTICTTLSTWYNNIMRTLET